MKYLRRFFAGFLEVFDSFFEVFWRVFWKFSRGLFEIVWRLLKIG